MRLRAMIQKNVGLAKRNATNHSYASIQVTFGRRRYACLSYGLTTAPHRLAGRSISAHSRGNHAHEINDRWIASSIITL